MLLLTSLLLLLLRGTITTTDIRAAAPAGPRASSLVLVTSLIIIIISSSSSTRAGRTKRSLTLLVTCLTQVFFKQVANNLADDGGPGHYTRRIKQMRPHWTSSARQEVPPK